MISNALNEGTLLLIWDGLAGEGKSRGSRLAALALRYIASMGIPGTKHAELMVGGRLDLGKMFRAFSELDGADTVEAIEKRADFIKNLKLKDQFARIPSLQGLSILAYTAAIWSVASNDQMNSWQRGLTIASAAVGAAESIGHIAIAVKVYRGQLDALEMTKPVANTIGRISVFLGAVASGFAWHEDHKFGDLLSFAGGTLRVEGYIFSLLVDYRPQWLGRYLLGTRIAAGWLAFAGTLLGVAAIAWSLVPPIEAEDVGVAVVLPPSFELMLDPKGAFADREPELRAALARVPQRTLNVELGAVAGLFTVADRAGSPGAWGDSEAPTYHAAHMFGLMAPEIATLFGTADDEVAGAGIPTSFRGTKRPSGI